MELSEHERRVLGEIEAAMAAENPRLASTLGTASLGKSTRITRGAGGRPGRLTSRVAARIATHLAGFVAGVVLLAVGLRLNDGVGTAFGVAGCVLIVAGVTAAVSHRHGDPDWRSDPTAGWRTPKGRAPRR